MSLSLIVDNIDFKDMRFMHFIVLSITMSLSLIVDKVIS